MGRSIEIGELQLELCRVGLINSYLNNQKMTETK